jgi:hypothetical protein
MKGEGNEIMAATAARSLKETERQEREREREKSIVPNEEWRNENKDVLEVTRLGGITILLL